MNTRLLLITTFLYLFIALIIFLFNKHFLNNKILASISNKSIYINQPVFFSDSTDNAKDVLWEFGNGEKSKKRKGFYVYKKEGRYLIRLTVNEKLRDTFSILVRPLMSNSASAKNITIVTTNKALTGQKVHFKILGPHVDWCEWYFGESGKIDSREAETFHSYSEPGTYKVKLLTNQNSDPIFHTIVVSDPFKSAENIVEPMPQAPSVEEKDELLIEIQKIADGENVSKIYDRISKNHLCSKLHMKVIVNNNSAVDFYSYCQSLQLGNRIIIDKIIKEVDRSTNCPTRLSIIQH